MSENLSSAAVVIAAFSKITNKAWHFMRKLGKMSQNLSSAAVGMVYVLSLYHHLQIQLFLICL